MFHLMFALKTISISFKQLSLLKNSFHQFDQGMGQQSTSLAMSEVSLPYARFELIPIVV